MRFLLGINLAVILLNVRIFPTNIVFKMLSGISLQGLFLFLAFFFLFFGFLFFVVDKGVPILSQLSLSILYFWNVTVVPFFSP